MFDILEAFSSSKEIAYNQKYARVSKELCNAGNGAEIWVLFIGYRHESSIHYFTK